MSQRSETAQQAMLGALKEERVRVSDGVVSPSSDWTLAMMEHMFARRPELETYAWRIQGGA